MADGRPVYIESPFAAAAGKGELFLTSSPTIVWRSQSVFADTGVVDPHFAVDSVMGVRISMTGNASVIPRPPMSGDVIWPRAAYDHGVAHVVWATSNDTTRFASLRPTTIWYAQYDGRRWSVPERVFAGVHVVWNETSAPPIFANGQPSLVVPAADSSSRADHQGLAYLVRTAGGAWRTSWIATRGPLPLFASQVSTANVTLVAFLGAVLYSGRPGDLNSIFVVRSTDGGVSWTRPMVIKALHQSRGFDLQLTGSLGAGLHLVWAVDSGQSTNLVQTVSRDSGATWRDATTLLLPPVEALSVAMLRGRPVVVGRRAGTDSLVEIDLGNPGAPSLVGLPFERASGMPRLSAIGPDSAALVWSVDRPGTYPLVPQIIPLASLIAIATSRCP